MGRSEIDLGSFRIITKTDVFALEDRVMIWGELNTSGKHVFLRVMIGG